MHVGMLLMKNQMAKALIRQQVTCCLIWSRPFAKATIVVSSGLWVKRERGQTSMLLLSMHLLVGIMGGFFYEWGEIIK